jgi:hypothetical protein
MLDQRPVRLQHQHRALSLFGDLLRRGPEGRGLRAEMPIGSPAFSLCLLPSANFLYAAAFIGSISRNVLPLFSWDST